MVPPGRRFRLSPVFAILIGLALVGWVFWVFQGQAVVGVAPRGRVLDFALPDVTGKTVRVSDYLSRPLILRFSSRTCSFCGDDFALLERIQETFDGGVQVIAVELVPRNLVQQMVPALAARGASYPILVDVDGKIADRYQPRGLPMHYFVHPGGIVKAAVWSDPSRIDFDCYIGLISRH